MRYTAEGNKPILLDYGVQGFKKAKYESKRKYSPGVREDLQNEGFFSVCRVAQQREACG